MDSTTQNIVRPRTPTTITDDTDWSAWHHPRWRGTDANGSPVFDTFTPQDPEPVVPHQATDALLGNSMVRDPDPDKRAIFHRICDEVQEARWHWMAARHIFRVTGIVSRIAVHGKAYLAAKREADELFNALRNTPDNMWRSTLMRLADARARARDATGPLDNACQELDRLPMPGDQVDALVPSVHDIARDAGLDLAGLDLYPTHRYIYQATVDFEEQDRTITEVARLAGDPVQRQP